MSNRWHLTVHLTVMQQKMSFGSRFRSLTATSSVWSLCESRTLRGLPFHFILGRTFLWHSACREMILIFLWSFNGWEYRAWSETELRVGLLWNSSDLRLYVAFLGPESYTLTTTQAWRWFHLSWSYVHVDKSSEKRTSIDRLFPRHRAVFSFPNIGSNRVFAWDYVAIVSNQSKC